MIQVTDLTKHYGHKRALGPIAFEIGDGESVGFLGLNGAGKTTALRIMACDLRPSGGSITIDKVNAIENPHEVRKSVGFLPEQPPLYGDMTVDDYLMFAGRIQGLDRSRTKKRIAEVEDVTQTRDVGQELIRNLSHGFQQRVGVAQAIIHEPKLLILDEPTRGLDPVQIVEMRSLIRRLKENHTILISSHVLPEISETCDRLLVLGAGEIVASGTEAELSSRAAHGPGVTVTVAPAGDKVDEDTRKKVLECIKAVDGVKEITSGRVVESTLVIDATTSTECRAAVCKALVDAGHGVLRLDRAERRLEQLFMDIVKGARGASAEGGSHVGN